MVYKLFSIHSVIDVITNSSTEIYTFQDGSVEPVKELLTEVLGLCNIAGTVEDYFYVKVLPTSFVDDSTEAMIEFVLKGTAPETEEEFEATKMSIVADESSGSSVVILPKQEMFNTLANKVIQVLNSPISKEVYC